MPEDALTELQREVLRLFFGLPESAGFVLAGGAALIASGLSERPTQDVDLFTSNLETGIADAVDALEAACLAQGWTVEAIRTTETFRRIIIRSTNSQLLVDVGIDSPPTGPPTITPVGPTYPPDELGARKLLALFGRAAARDFVDAYALSSTFDLAHLLDIAADLDEGLDLGVLVEMLATLDRYTDDDITALGADPKAVRTFIDQWRNELENPRT
jgi:predicted nucleotidyltransferase component of viral defense system